MKGLLAAAALFGVLGAASPATAGPGERAAVDVERSEQHFKKGTRAFEEQKYSEAYASLRTAYDLAPTYRTAAGLGQVELHLGQYRDAAEHLSFCLRHYPADGDPTVKGHVEEGLAQARERVAALRVRVNVEGAEVSVDGSPAGKSPLEGLLFVEPGSHVVSASREGKQARHTVEAHVRATEDVDLTLPLDSAPAESTPPGISAGPGGADTSTVSSKGLPPSTWALVIGGSLTAVALGTSIVFQVKAAGADEDAAALASGIPGDSGCRSPADASGPCAALNDKLDDRNAANRIGLVAAVGSGVFAAATAVTFFALRSSERSREASARPWALGFRAAAGGGGLLTLQGGF